MKLLRSGVKPGKDFKSLFNSNSGLGTYLYFRDLTEINYRLFGDKTIQIYGRIPPEFNILSLEPDSYWESIESILDVGPGFSIYSYQLAGNLSEKYGTDIKLTLLDPCSTIIKYHTLIIEEGPKVAESWLKSIYDTPPKITEYLREIDPRNIDVDIRESKVEKKIPKSDLVIVSYVLKYLSYEDLFRALDNIYKNTKKLGIVISFWDEYILKGVIRKKAFILDSEEVFLQDRKDPTKTNLDSVFGHFDSLYHKNSCVFSAYSNETDFFSPLWQNLNLLIFQDLF